VIVAHVAEHDRAVGHITCDDRHGELRRLSEAQSPRCASDAFTVCHAEPCDDEESLASVRRSNVRGAEIKPERIIPRFGKVSENDVQPPRQESCDVLHDDDARSKNASDARELKPQTAALACEASAFPSDRHVLTWEPAAEDVNAGSVGADASHVVISKSVRPVSREDAAAPRVLFALPDRRDIVASIAKRTLKAEIQPTDTREQRPDGERAGHANTSATMRSAVSACASIDPAATS